MSYGVPSASASSSALQHRLRERVADDRHLRHLLALRRSRHSSCASKCRPSSVTMRPPAQIDWNVVNAPVPCINGDAGRCAVSRRRRGSSVRADRPRTDARAAPSPTSAYVAVGEHAPQVVVAPHHALGHAGGAAGVEEVQVLAGALDARHRLVLGDELLVTGPRSPGAARRRRPGSTTARSGARSRIFATRSPRLPWKSSASASELSSR